MERFPEMAHLLELAHVPFCCDTIIFMTESGAWIKVD